jgi:hypothetical protein
MVGERNWNTARALNTARMPAGSADALPELSAIWLVCTSAWKMENVSTANCRERRTLPDTLPPTRFAQQAETATTTSTIAAMPPAT